jgi:hypothetical protein
MIYLLIADSTVSSGLSVKDRYVTQLQVNLRVKTKTSSHLDEILRCTTQKSPKSPLAPAGLCSIAEAPVQSNQKQSTRWAIRCQIISGLSPNPCFLEIFNQQALSPIIALD